jgi:uncharacterized membrane protein (UPF0136 family)
MYSDEEGSFRVNSSFSLLCGVFFFFIIKLQDKNEDLKINEIVDLKINLKIFNKNNKVYKKKIIPLKILANIISTSR